MAHQTLSFEKAFERLEEILELMNSGKVPLEQSLKLFEEAEILMRHCGETLQSAEQKIERLIKERNGTLALDANQQPKRQPLEYPSQDNRPFETGNL